MDRFIHRLIRWRWAALAVWVLGAAALLLVPPPGPQGSSANGFLSADAASQQAIAALERHFKLAAGLSQAVVVVERVDDPATETVEGLTAADEEALGRIATTIERRDDDGVDVGRLRLLNPIAWPFLRDAMVSPRRAGEGQAGLLVVQIPANFITVEASRVVDHVQRAVDRVQAAADPAWPKGLRAAVTGSAGFGHDYAVAAERSHDRTLWVSVAAVVGILLVVHRAPLSAAVPLVAIVLAGAVVRALLTVCAKLGLSVGAGERIFVTVLLFGAGVDYSLFFLGRYRERLAAGRGVGSAVRESWLSTAPAIAASAGTTIAGLFMLTFAQFGVFRNVGPAVAGALAVALIAALTFVPAMTAVLGRRLLWPARRPSKAAHGLWGRVGVFVSTRPAVTLVVSAVVLIVPALAGARIRWVYDTFADLQPDYPAMVGADIVRRHWPIGELAPVSVLIETRQDVDDEEFTRLVTRLTARLASLPEVSEVRSLTAPVGVHAGAHLARRPAKPAASSTTHPAGAPATRPSQASWWSDPFGSVTQLVSDAGGSLSAPLLDLGAQQSYLRPRATRLEVAGSDKPFSNAAMAMVKHIRAAITAELADPQFARTPLADAKVHLAGATAEMMDVRTVTRSDFRRVSIAALLVIVLIVLALLRDVVLSVFMVASTVLGYLAALGLTYWVFAGLLGAEGIDWKVEILLFVVMVAVGQDYNIFLATRLAQEAESARPAAAAKRAVAATGGIISSCGLIMAAALGSLMAGDLALLEQLGFALAVGMIFDTFVVRPLLLPAFAVLARRTGRNILGQPRRRVVRRRD